MTCVYIIESIESQINILKLYIRFFYNLKPSKSTWSSQLPIFINFGGRK